MRILLLVCFAASMFGQNAKLPPDIAPQSNSRLPLIQRNHLSDEDKKVFDDVANTAPGAGMDVQHLNRRVYPDAQLL